MMKFWLSRSLSHEFSSFFTMEFWLSRTFLLFLRWNSGYHEAFLTNFSSFFTMEFWLSRSISHELFFFFHDGILKIRDLGEDSFYTYITKSIYIGSASLKTLPLDLEPPLQGKEYGPSYSNITMKRKAKFFSPEITYRHVIRIFSFLVYKLTKIEKLLYVTSSYN
jgi:hypothetical protein